jgi:hypothetical protein
VRPFQQVHIRYRRGVRIHFSHFYTDNTCTVKMKSEGDPVVESDGVANMKKLTKAPSAGVASAFRNQRTVCAARIVSTWSHYANCRWPCSPKRWTVTTSESSSSLLLQRRRVVVVVVVAVSLTPCRLPALVVAVLTVPPPRPPRPRSPLRLVFSP